MIKQTSLDFLKELKNNNSKEWFEQNKTIYQTYKEDIILFAENLLLELEKLDFSIETGKPLIDYLNKDIEFEE